MTGPDRLLRFYRDCPADAREAAKQSYRRYHALTSAVADQLGLPRKTAAAVFSALSPNNNYIGNLRDMRRLLEAHVAGQDIGSFRVCTYHHNKRKAWSIARGEIQPEDALVAPKTRNFYLNIAFPDLCGPVTVDGHMYWAWMGGKGPVKSRVHTEAANVTPRLYHEIADAVRSISERRCLPHEMQAIVWQQFRRHHNVLGARQLELLPSDAFAVGLPPENFLDLQVGV